MIYIKNRGQVDLYQDRSLCVSSMCVAKAITHGTLHYIPSAHLCIKNIFHLQIYLNKMMLGLTSRKQSPLSTFSTSYYWKHLGLNWFFSALATKFLYV